MHHDVRRSLVFGGCGAAFITSACLAADMQLIYSEIPGSCSVAVPGARDLAGQPVAATWVSLLGLSVRVDADEWVVRGGNSLGSDLTNILVRGGGVAGDAFMQEGQPLQGGGKSGELYDFFDPTPVAWNAGGDMGYSLRARGGVTTNNEKIGTFVNGVHTILFEQGTPVTGLTGCTSPSIGNSVGSVTLLNSGVLAFGNTPVQGCPGTFYPALFHDTAAIAQSNVTEVGEGALGSPELIESLDFDDSTFTLDGLNWASIVNTSNPNTAADRGLVINTDMILREGSTIAGSTVVLTDIFALRYATNGMLYARGDDPTDNDWAWRDGVLIAATGQPITTGATENWGNSIASFFGNSSGDYLIVGNTDNGDLDTDTVLVLNDEMVLAREGDPVDVDGNGKFDDNAYVRTFTPDSAYLTDDNIVYFLATLRNTVASTGTNLGDAFIRIDLNSACDADIADAGASEGQVDIDDLLAVISAWGPCPAPPAQCPANIVGACGTEVNIDDLLAVISAWGPCP